MKRALGIGLLAAPFVAISGFVVSTAGWADLFAILGIAAAICGSIMLGAYLLDQAA